MLKRILARRQFLAAASAAWFGSIGKLATARSQPPDVGKVARLSPNDAIQVPGLPPGRVTAMVITPDRSRVLVAIDDRAGASVLGTLALAQDGEFQEWAKIEGAREISALAWSPSDGKTVAYVVRLEHNDPPSYETSLFTLTQGEAPLRRYVLSKERNPRNRQGRAAELAWPQKDAVCVAQRDLPWIESIALASGEKRRLYTADPPATLLDALRSASRDAVEFIRFSATSVSNPEEDNRPELIQLRLDGQVVKQKRLASGMGLIGGPLLGDSAYVYGMNVQPGTRAVRVFSRETNRTLFVIPVQDDEFLIPQAFSADGHILVCLGGPLSEIKRDEFIPKVLMFNLSHA